MKNKVVFKLCAIPAQTIIFGGNFLFSTTVFVFKGFSVPFECIPCRIGGLEVDLSKSFSRH